MAAQPAIHPSADALRAFALGKLNDTTASVVMNHLDSCPDCCKQVAALSGDDFLDRLREAHALSATPAPAKSLADAARAPKPSSSQTAVPNLPLELAANQQYEILRELGRGGMGVVYLAKNKLMDRLEVLKVVNKTLIDHPAAVERFLREIRSAAQLSHSNIVSAYSAVQRGELLAFAMEYVEGQDLASLVRSQGPLPIPNACYYVQQAASGMQHAFEKQLVHRDVKPQNLILAREGKKHIVKVLDFGLAKMLREKTEDTGLTGEGKMLGTPDYIAPEQTLDAAKADIRADIYSLGCTLYHLLSGRPPFSGSSLGAVLMAHQMQEAKPLNLVRPEVPEELAAVVRKMMAKSPAKRYQKPLEVVQALAPFVKPGGAPKSSPELSAGAAQTETAVKEAKKQPAPPVVQESRTQDSTSSAESRSSGRYSDSTIGSNLARSSPVVEPRKSRAARKRQSALGITGTQKRWLIGGCVAVGVLLMSLLGVWQSGMFNKVKTPEGNVGIEAKEPPQGKENGQPLLVAREVNNMDYDLTGGFRFADFRSANPRVVLTYNDDMQEQFFAQVYDLAIGKPLCRPAPRHLQSVVRAAFSPDGKWLITESADNTARVWDVASGQGLLTQSLQHDQPVNHASFSPDGKRVVTACADNTAVVWDARTGKPVFSPLQHDGAVNYATFSPDNTRLATASDDNTARLWDANTGQALPWKLEHKGAVSHASFSPDGERVITASADGTARIWNARTGQPLSPPLKHDQPVNHATFSPDGRLVVTAGADNKAQLWDASTSKDLMTPLEHAQTVRQANFSPDSKRVVTASGDNTARVWDASTGQALSPPLEHENSVIHAAFSRDGKLVISISEDNTARLWNAETGEELKKVTITPD